VFGRDAHQSKQSANSIDGTKRGDDAGAEGAIALVGHTLVAAGDHGDIVPWQQRKHDQRIEVSLPHI
jgi:hypothetical protein